jgi:YVTN family beta-propeller protein
VSTGEGVPITDLGIEGITDAVVVGQGSFGVVYRATQPAYRRTVAVKVLSMPLTADADRKRFERECQALGSLSGHPNIVALYSSGVAVGGHPYMIMDYLDGGSLGARLKADGPLSWPEATAIGVKIAGALALAHQSGILHRDIKPDNILISNYGEPQLADFGVARLQGGSESLTAGGITGSLVHAAPEVISGVTATPAADIWSLASTIATLLIGQPPFHRDGDETLSPLITRILTQPPVDMRGRGVPEQICAVIDKGLAKDSWERPETAADFGRMLQAAQQALGYEPTPMAAPDAPAAASAASLADVPTPPPPKVVDDEDEEQQDDENRTRTRTGTPAADIAVAVAADAVVADAATSEEEEQWPHKAEPETTTEPVETPPPPPPDDTDAIPVAVEKEATPPPNRRRLAVVIAVAVVALLAIALVVSRGGSGKKEAAPPPASTTTVTTSPPTTTAAPRPPTVAATIALGTSGDQIAPLLNSLVVSEGSAHQLASIDPSNGQVATTASLPNKPHALVADNDTLWVTANDAPVVLRLRPGATPDAPQIDSVAVDAVIHQIAFGDGGVWCTSSSLLRIDPASNQVVATIDAGPSIDSVADGEGGVWVANRQASGTVTRVDPATNKVMATIPVGANPDQVAAGMGAVWTANSQSGDVSRINPATNQVVATIPIGGKPLWVTVGLGAVWVTDSTGNRVLRIDPATNTVTGTVTVGGNPEASAIAGGSVWVVNRGDDTVTRIDPGT